MTFSIVLPFYGELNNLKVSLKSIYNQDFSDYELLIIDDNKKRNWNKKDLQELLKSYKINNFKIFLNKRNKGANYSRNLGIKYSIGNYVCFIDCGDTWYDNKLSSEFFILNKNPDLIYSKQRFRHKSFSVVHNKDHYPDYFKSQMLSSICTSSAMTIKKKFLLTIDMFDPQLKSSQDADLLLRILLVTKNICFINKILTSKSIDKVNSISSNVIFSDNTFIHVRLPYLHLFDKNVRSAVFFSFYSSRLLRNFNSINVKKEVYKTLNYKPINNIEYLLLFIKLFYYYLNFKLIRKN